MTYAQILLIVIVLVPLGLTLFNKLRPEIAALIIAAGLGIAQFLGVGMLGPADTPQDAVKAISGFGQPIIITLISLFIITRALEKSGVTRWLANQLIAVGGSSETRLIGLFAGVTAILSLFMNNLAAGALILPSAIESARRTGIKPSRLLIPVAYGSLLGGAATYFTTANIITSDMLRIADPPQTPLGIMAFTPTGGLIALVGILFLALAGRRTLPEHPPSPEQMLTRLTGSELEDFYALRERLWEATVQPDSPLVGKTLAQSAIGETLGVEIAAIWRGRLAIFSPLPDQFIHAGDILLVVGREERVLLLSEQNLVIGRELSGEHISPYGVTFVEIILAPHSGVEGKTLKQLDFRKRYGFTAVALLRKGRSYRTNVGDFQLELGDALLVIGSREHLPDLRRATEFILLEPSQSDQPLERKPALLASLVMAAAIIASILGVPVFLAMLVGAVIIILSGSLNTDEAFRSVQWQAVFLIAGMYTVSLAMVQTGLADVLGNALLRMVTPAGSAGAGGGRLLALGGADAAHGRAGHCPGQRAGGNQRGDQHGRQPPGNRRGGSHRMLRFLFYTPGAPGQRADDCARQLHLRRFHPPRLALDFDLLRHAAGGHGRILGAITEKRLLAVTGGARSCNRSGAAAVQSAPGWHHHCGLSSEELSRMYDTH